MKTLKIISLGLILLLVSGFCDTNKYIEHDYSVPLKAGESVYSVANDHYDLNENGECFDAFRYRVLERNKHLFRNGRKPQIGDVVVVPVMVKK